MKCSTTIQAYHITQVGAARGRWFPFCAKAGKVAEGRMGCGKQGAVWRRLAAPVVQSALRVCSGPHPIRRYAPPSPASWGRGPPRLEMYEGREERLHEFFWSRPGMAPQGLERIES